MLGFLHSRVCWRPRRTGGGFSEPHVHDYAVSARIYALSALDQVDLERQRKLFRMHMEIRMKEGNGHKDLCALALSALEILGHRDTTVEVQ